MLGAWPASLALTHMLGAWPASLALTHMLGAWPAFLALTHMLGAWQASLALTHMLGAWQASLALTHMLGAWQAYLALTLLSLDNKHLHVWRNKWHDCHYSLFQPPWQGDWRQRPALFRDRSRGVNVSTDNLWIYWESRRECGLALIISHPPQKGEKWRNGRNYKTNNNNIITIITIIIE